MPTRTAPAPDKTRPQTADKNGQAPAPRKGRKKEVPPPAEVKFPELKAKVCQLDKALTAADMKRLLGWETLAEYMGRVGVPEEACPPPHLKDLDGTPVYLWNNEKNRPLDRGHCLELAQVLLDRQWAGPTTFPGETINGETMTVARSGQVKSGQHRGVGLIFAWQKWLKAPYRWPAWETEPVLETLLVTGVSDAPEIARTIDNVKARSLADVFYTSGMFDGLSLSDRQLCSKMLESAVGFLWRRTGAGQPPGGEKVYKTHPQAVAFVGSHPRLQQCLRHILACQSPDMSNNGKGDRALSKLGLSSGHCAAILYLMGSCRSDGDVYRNLDEPSEKALDFTEWEAAKGFFTDLWKGTPELAGPVKEALGRLVDPEDSEGGRAVEKYVVLSKAWERYRKGEKITARDIYPKYMRDEDGKVLLAEWTDFGGIDLGEPARDEPDPIPPAEPEVTQSKAAERKRRQAEEEAREQEKADKRRLQRERLMAERRASREAELATATDDDSDEAE